MVSKASSDKLSCSFCGKSQDDVKKVSKLADLVVCGSSIVNKIKEGSQNGLSNHDLAHFVGEYVNNLSKGVKH